VQKNTPDNLQTNKTVIWEIILRDSWGAILRALLTRALNLRPIAVRKSSSTTEDGHGVRWQTTWRLPPADARYLLKGRCGWQDRARHQSRSGSDAP
jgi:hypothetical protein